jgi:hypothetical protein
MPGMAQLPPQAAAQDPMMADPMSPDNLAAFEQLRQEMPPSEFTADILDSAQEADPVAVAEFRAELQDLALPPEVLDVLNQMLDEVLAAPDQYPQIRAKYLAQDIPEDLLPPAFDPEFFGALNLAVDQIRATTNMPMPPMGFARGGIASLNPLAAAMAQQGRYGDTMLAHISPREAAMLKDMGGSGTINPMTGMPEFFIKKLFKGAKKALKKVGQAVKKFASSSVGKIVTTMALAFFLGPAAATAMGISSTAGVAAVSGFVGSAGSTALGGGNLKESLKAGALGGLTAGAGAGVMGGAQAFQAGSYTGPTTVGGQFTKAKEFFTGAPAEAAAAPAPVDMGTAPSQTGAVRSGIGEQSPIQRARYFGEDMQMPSPLSQGIESVVPGASRSATGTPMMAGGFDPNQAATSRLPQVSRVSAPTATTASVAPATSGGTLNIGRAGAQPQGQSGFRVGQQYPDLPSLPDSMRADVSTGADKNIFQRGLDRILPGRIEERGVADALKQTRAEFPGLSVEQIENAAPTSAVGKFYASKLPGPISKYAPLAATGLGIMALGGGFDEEEVAPPAGFEDFMSGISPGQRLLDQDPQRYGLSYGGVGTTASTPQYRPYSFTPPPTGRAKGGSMDKEFPRKTGPINGPGTGTSDDIPAMLSDGEFVFTAKAVRNMGDGSRRKGAQRMYALMRKLEGRKNG